MGDLKNFSKLQVNTRSSHPEVFCKKMFLKILQISQKNVFAGVPFLIKLQAGNLKLSEAATGDVLLKKGVLKKAHWSFRNSRSYINYTKWVLLNNSQNSQQKTCVGVSF